MRPRDCLIYRWSEWGYIAELFVFITAPHCTYYTTGMRWTHFADAQNQLKRRWCGGRMLQRFALLWLPSLSVCLFLRSRRTCYLASSNFDASGWWKSLYADYVMFLTRRDLSFVTQGIWVPCFAWISCEDVYVVLGCEHPYDYRNFVSGCLLLHVCVLVDFLDFVDVFQREFSNTYCWGACCVYQKNVLVYAEKPISGG